MDKKYYIEKLNLRPNFFEEEKKCGYIISEEMKKVWAVQLDLLFELIRVCEKYDIKYQISSGTLLGAVRHKGYIPWDDDLDIMMFPKDYEKLKKVGQKEFKGKYFFQTTMTDENYFRGHAQLRNSETTAILESESNKVGYNEGCFIDIFSLNNLPEGKEKEQYYKELEEIQGKLFNAIYYKKYSCKKIVNWWKKFILYNAFAKNRLRKKQDRLISKYNNRKRIKKVGLTGLIPNASIELTKENMMELGHYEFEGLKVIGPKNYDKVLTEQYGDWEKPMKTKNVHGKVFFDTERPYTFYKKK